ncbi:26857_t:CDS:10 [Gigaspora margarita]|uniref:26857_t:CDS:1 n=1 Tax=Gigaspora margarita TaxID=4874 RepID=A0ABM8W1E1_GIGMA|nr:26857_t:CDS:10 [Gigaspora margarita]
MVIFFFFLVAFLVSGQANKEEFHKETTNSSINCNERTESSNYLKPPDIVSDQTNKEFHKETTNPSKSPDCETIYDSVSDNFQDNKEEFHNEVTNLSKLLDRETVYDSITEYSNQLKPPGCETKYDLDIKHSELTDLKVFESGGFGIVYKGQWNGLCIAAKVVKRGNSTELKNKDFNRELAALRKSKYCKDYIIQFYGLSQEERKVGMPMKYIEIYEKCWNPVPSLRPEMFDILRDLECLEKEEGLTCTEQNISLTESPVQYSTIPKNLPNYTAQMQLHSILTVDLKQSITLDTFLPLFEKVHQLRRTWIPLNMQLNKKMCRRLGQCIIDAEHNICTLENQLDIRCKRSQGSVNVAKNYVSFQAFLRNIESIKYFIENISQIGGLKSFVRVIDSTISLNLLKNEYIKLLTEFNESISSLNFESRINKQVSDITSEFIEALQCNFDEVDYMFGFIDQINNSIKNSSTNDDLFYDQTMKSIKEFKDGNIQKTDDGSITIIKQFHQDDQDEKNDIFVQAKLLKASKGLINIAKFYGIIQDTSSPNSRYVIIEWSDHGNLKEYYVKHKPLNPLIKLNFAFNICNGLVFLNALNFLHRDIRPENILITGSTSNLKAKITKFFHSRLMTDETKNIGLANEKTPFEDYDIHLIKDKIINQDHQWNFDNSMPEEYIEISIKEQFKLNIDGLNIN